MCDDFENGHDIEGGELTCEEPKITWEWYPGDVGPYGDGVLIITAKGDGFVMLEADERSRTGQDEASMNIKAEYGQTIIAEAYIARAGTAVSPTARRVIVVPEKDQQSEPTPGPQPAPESKCPVLAFGDENGQQINEISLAPGQKKTVQIILTKHPESITRAFQAQWIMYDSKHKPTGGITCEEGPSTKNWFSPMNLSTSAEAQGGMKGNTTSSARFQSSNWRCVAYNSLGKPYWHPRGEFTTPIAVAEFTIQAPSGWKDTFATFELDPEWTLFVETYDDTVGSLSQIDARCNYDMKLTIKNEKPDSGVSGIGPSVNPAPESKCPVLAFGDENDNLIKEVHLAPGEQKTIRLILTKHPEVITMGNRLVFYLRDASGKPTQGIAFDCDYDCGRWIKPLNLSTSNTSVGGLQGNTVNDDHGEIGRYICTLFNFEKNQVWYPRGNFMPPIAVGEFVIKASSDWNDAYATIEIDPKKTQFVLTADTTPFSNGYEVYLDYTLALTVKNKNKHQSRRE